jgi:pimeloyl-ACP methyl ester carboxylesterase
MATIVLVHGGWFGGWCWQKVIPFLETAGQEVFAPTLTGLAERASELSPDVGLDTHIQDVVGLLEEKNLHDVILVGHSYGGMVITGVVDRVPERIAHLVYLDTFVPRDGDSMTNISRIINWILRRQTRDGWRVDPLGTYGVTAEPDRSWVLSKLTPQSLKTFEQPLHLKNPAIVSTKPRTHIDCTGGGFLRSLARRMCRGWRLRQLGVASAGWRLRQLRTGHMAMILMPRKLADLLLEVV